PRTQSVALPPIDSISTLFLKTFRGVRAISQFDWPFTPTLRSSGNFSTFIGSVLHYLLRQLQPAQGKITMFRVYLVRLHDLLGLALASNTPLYGITSLDMRQYYDYYAKVTPPSD